MLLIVIAGTFFLLEAAPGDAVDAYLLSIGGGDPALVQSLRESYGLDQSVFARLWLYVTALARLDLGWSVVFGRPILDIILERLPNTLWLMGSAVALSFGLGSLLGIVAGARPGSAADRTLSIAWHLVLPVAALGFIYLALFLRMMRSGMAEAWRQHFALAARAKGLARRRIVVRHIARNALLPVVTMLGMLAATMLGGSVVIESVFAIPGFGRLAQEAVAGRDAPLLTGIIVVSAILVISVNLAVDIAYALLDPRVGAAEASA